MRSWKTSWKLIFNGINCRLGRLGNFRQHLACKRPRQTSSLCRLNKVAAFDFIDPVMPAVPDRHREFQLLALDLPGSKTWLCRKDVINRRKLELAASPQEDAEILGMPIRRPDQPKIRLGL